MSGGGNVAAPPPPPRELLSAFLCGEEPLEPFLQWVVSDCSATRRSLQPLLQAIAAHEPSASSPPSSVSRKNVKEYQCPPRKLRAEALRRCDAEMERALQALRGQQQSQGHPGGRPCHGKPLQPKDVAPKQWAAVSLNLSSTADFPALGGGGGGGDTGGGWPRSRGAPGRGEAAQPKASRRRLVPTPVSTDVPPSAPPSFGETDTAPPPSAAAAARSDRQARGASERLKPPPVGPPPHSHEAQTEEPPHSEDDPPAGRDAEARARAPADNQPEQTLTPSTSSVSAVSEDEQQPSPGTNTGAASKTTSSRKRTDCTLGNQGQPAGIQLPHALHRLSALHSLLLFVGAVPDLALQLGRLLRLLAAGLSWEGMTADAASGSLEIVAAPCSYVLAVLSGTPRLLTAVPGRALSAFVDPAGPTLSQLQQRTPDLLGAIQSALAKEQSTRFYNEKAYTTVPSTLCSGASLVGVLTPGQSSARTPEEVHKRSNLERCRDEFVAVIQEAAHVPFSAFKSTEQGSADGMSTETLSCMQIMRQRGPALLQKLLVANLPGLAEMWMGGFLQAARTGEVLVDDKLVSLAQKDPSRFQRMSQRFHSQQHVGHGKSRGGGTLRGGGRGRGGRGGSTGSQPPVAQVIDQTAAASAVLMEEFPYPIRLYVMFLEATDSARLSKSIEHLAFVKVMELSQSKRRGQQSLQGRGGEVSGVGPLLPGGLSPGVALGERVAEVSALALLLSYLSFAHRASTRPLGGLEGSPVRSPESSAMSPNGVPGALDVALLMREVSREGGALLMVLPLVLSYTNFLAKDPLAVAAVRQSDLVPLLRTLHGSPDLRPSHAGFGLASLCVRSMLEEWAIGIAGQSILGADGFQGTEATDDSPHAAGAQPRQSDSGHLPTWHSLSDTLRDASGILDVRYVSHCCPQLEDGVRGMMSLLSDAGTAQGQSQKPVSRRLTPSQPSMPVALRVPPEVEQAASPAKDPEKLRLQKAFLDSYSGPGRKVSLRELVAYVSDVATANALMQAQAERTGGALADLEDQIRPLAEAAAAQLAADMQRTSGAALCQRLQTGAQEQQAMDAIVNKATFNALQLAHDEAKAITIDTIKRALAALVPPDLKGPVLETSLGIAIEYALSACAQQLIETVPKQVRAHVNSVCMAVASSVVSSRDRPATTEAAPAAGGAVACLPPSDLSAARETSVEASFAAEEAEAVAQSPLPALTALALHSRTPAEAEAKNEKPLLTVLSWHRPGSAAVADPHGQPTAHGLSSVVRDDTDSAGHPMARLNSSSAARACDGIQRTPHVATPTSKPPSAAGAIVHAVPGSAGSVQKGVCVPQSPQFALMATPNKGAMEPPSPRLTAEGTPQAAILSSCSASRLLPGGSQLPGSLRAIPQHTQSPTVRLDKSKARALQSRIDPLRLDVDAFEGL